MMEKRSGVGRSSLVGILLLKKLYDFLHLVSASTKGSVLSLKNNDVEQNFKTSSSLNF